MYFIFPHGTLYIIKYEIELNMISKRNYCFDLLRVVGCIMVVILHSPRPGDLASQNGFFLSLLAFLVSPCVPIFFILSGALLLNFKGETFSFLIKRFKKFIGPILIWSIFYIANKIVIGKLTEIGEILTSIASIPFSCQEGVLWFMYTLAGLYLLTPILAPYFRSASKKEFSFYIIIWMITLCYPYIQNYFNLYTTFLPRIDLLYYFSGFIGYYLLGFYLKKFFFDKQQNLKAIIIIFIITTCAFFAGLKYLDKTYNLGIDQNGGWEFQSLQVMIYTLLWFIICNWACKTSFFRKKLIMSIINFIANLSFGVYLCHILLMRPWIWDIPFIANMQNFHLQTFLIILFDFMGSLLLCFLISLLPFSKYIIGYHFNRKIGEKITSAI